MKQTLLFLVGLAWICLPACSALKPASYPEEPFTITYGSKPCFGQCPELTLLFNGNNGLITLEGKAYVDKLGTYQKQLSPEEVNELRTTLQESGFFSLEDRYPAETDNPRLQTLYISLGERSHTVSVYGDAPPAFEELRRYFYAQIQGGGWQPMAQ